MEDQNRDKIILVDENDNEIGDGEKMETHLNGGKLHRAFSVFLFNSKGDFLLQKRHDEKYHCPKLWANTCCSHPFVGETTEAGAKRRLMEEMGIECDLKEVFDFIYRAEFDNGLTEHEYDHVFVGKFDGEPVPNPKEVSDWKWISEEELRKDIKANPNKYVPWLKIILNEHDLKI